MSVFKLLQQTLFNRTRGEMPSSAAPPEHDLAESTTKKVLNVGGNSKAIAIPNYYDGWTHHLLDIDPTGNPDVLCDARTLVDLPGNAYDSVYCSHNLEHYYSHDVAKVLTGFHHILKNDGFVDIRVPDMKAVINHMVANDMDIDDVLYKSVGGESIAIKDVIYGWGRQIEESGEDFFSHKTGFSEKSLTTVLRRCGFTTVYVLLTGFDLQVLGFKQQPSQQQQSTLNLLTQGADEALAK